MSFLLCTRAFVGTSIDGGSIFFLRDGDTVEICVEVDGTQLHIRDNHLMEEQDNLPVVKDTSK